MDYTEIPSLLFYVSGNSFRADKAQGKAKPTFCKAVSLIEDGVKGGAISCDTALQKEDRCLSGGVPGIPSGLRRFPFSAWATRITAAGISAFCGWIMTERG